MHENLNLGALAEIAHQQALVDEYISSNLEAAILELGHTPHKDVLRNDLKPLLVRYYAFLAESKQDIAEHSTAELKAAFLTLTLLIDLGLTSSLYEDAAQAQNSYLNKLKDHPALPYFLDAATGQSAGSNNPIWQIVLQNLAA